MEISKRQFLKGLPKTVIGVPLLPLILEPEKAVDNEEYTLVLPPAEAGRMVTIVNTGKKWLKITS